MADKQIFCTFAERSCLALAGNRTTRHCQSAATWRVTRLGCKSDAARNVLQGVCPERRKRQPRRVPSIPMTKFLAKDPLSHKGRAGSNPASGRH